jgi:hypothetical protein
MRIRMFPASCALVLLICCPRPANAQTHTLPQPIQLLLEDMQPSQKLPEISKSDKISVEALGESAESNSSEMVRTKETLRQWQETAKQKTLSSGGSSDCAHITIYKAPEMDSSMIQAVPKEFASNMPKLRGSQPCYCDLPPESLSSQAKPFDPKGHFLPATGKPEYKLVP